MSFLRRLLGGGKPHEPASPDRPTRTERRPPPEAKAPDQSSAPPPPPPRPKPAIPTLADLEPHALRAYFEYVGGGSSKFYAVSLEEEDGGTWRVRFNFGRIGAPREWQSKVEAATWRKAATAYMAVVDERIGKGYEIAAWPGTLKLPDGATIDEAEAAAGAERDQVLFRATKRGVLPPARGGSVAGVPLPDGILYAPQPEGGSRGDEPVIWASEAPMSGVGRAWAQLAAAFSATGLWPFVIDASFGFGDFDNYLMDMPRSRHTEVLAVLRKGWNDTVGYDEDYPDDEIAPFGKTFPGLAEATPGERVRSIDELVASATGHLGLVAVNRPADSLDAVGWMGAANYDGDPLHMTTVLRSWEQRFDAYLVGMTGDTITLAVGRPPRDLASATAIAAEHFAFCPDNIQQGVGSIREYAAALVGERLWPFWWD